MSAGSVDAALAQVGRGVYEGNVPRVRKDVSTAVTQFSALSANVDTYISDTGNSELIVCLNGTVPIKYNSRSYNIPVRIWVQSRYPFVGPLIFVTPVGDMFIKSGHKHVDMNGLCYHPYLTNWDPSRSTLAAAIHEMCQVFSAEPPVRAGTPATQSYPTPTPSYQQPYGGASPAYGGTASYGGAAGGGYGGGSYTAPAPTPAYTPSPYGGGAPPVYQAPAGGASNGLPAYSAVAPSGSSSGSRTNTPTSYPTPAPAPSRPEDPRTQLLTTATEETRLQLGQFNREMTNETDQLLAEQQSLHRETHEARQTLAQIEASLATMAADEQDLRERETQLTAWLAANDKDTGAPINIDEATRESPLVQQLFDVTAEDLAIEDVVYSLNSGLNEHVIDLDTYLKSVRKLFRDQFLAKALQPKIMEKLYGVGAARAAARV